MAYADYAMGQGWSGHQAPTSQQTNPNNNPEIAASQERLRRIGAFDFNDLSSAQVGGWVRKPKSVQSGMDVGDMGYEWVREVTYNTPGGILSGSQRMDDTGTAPTGSEALYGVSLRSGEKYWWNEGLAEAFSGTIGTDGRLMGVTPDDTRYSFGEQIGDFVGNLATMAASGLAAYGAAAGLGAAAGGTAAGSIAGITGADALRLALLAGAVGRSGGGGGSGAGGAGQTDVAAGIKPPEAPPAPSAGLGFDPIALFQQNRTRNQTDLNPQRVRPLVALGNTLLGA